MQGGPTNRSALKRRKNCCSIPTGYGNLYLPPFKPLYGFGRVCLISPVQVYGSFTHASPCASLNPFFTSRPEVKNDPFREKSLPFLRRIAPAMAFKGLLLSRPRIPFKPCFRWTEYWTADWLELCHGSLHVWLTARPGSPALGGLDANSPVPATQVIQNLFFGGEEGSFTEGALKMQLLLAR